MESLLDAAMTRDRKKNWDNIDVDDCMWRGVRDITKTEEDAIDRRETYVREQNAVC